MKKQPEAEDLGAGNCFRSILYSLGLLLQHMFTFIELILLVQSMWDKPEHTPNTHTNTLTHKF